MLLGQGLEAFEGDGARWRARGPPPEKVVECDFAVVGIGITPRTDLDGPAPGITVENGIVANAHLETSAPGIFVAGDAANAWHPFYERHIRVEHWANALNQGPAAARAMLGEDVSYDRIRYFFSDQYDVGMEYSGYATSHGTRWCSAAIVRVASSSPSG